MSRGGGGGGRGGGPSDRAGRAWAVALYALFVRAFPAPVRKHDGEEMVAAFAALWADASGVVERVRVAHTTFGRLPLVVTVEWLEEMGFAGTRTTGGWEMRGWGKNLRYAMRTLRKAPAFTATTVLLIGLGVGAVTTIFTVVDHVLLRPLPYPDPDRLVTVQQGAYSGIAFRAFQEIDVVDAWVAGTTADANLTGEGDPIRIEQARVAEGFFPFFGARPAHGRLLIDDDFGTPDRVVVSHRAWQSIFGEDPELVGRTLRVDGEPVVVLGVLEEGFLPPGTIVSPDAALYRPIDWTREELSNPGYHSLNVVGRLGTGTTIETLQAQLDDTSARLGQAYPDQMQDREGDPFPMPAAWLQEATVQNVRTGLNLLLGAVALLLLVACLNVAHLFLARGLGRVQEMAVRRALGAGAGGLAQQLLVESLVIGVSGGLFGLVLARVGLGALLALNPHALPRSEAVVVDLRVATFAACIAVGTAVLFGLVPALRTVGHDLTNELKGADRGSTSGRGTRRLRNGLVVIEVAVSLVLVAQAGLLLKSFLQVQAHQPGFEAEGLWTVPLTPTGLETPEQYVSEMGEVLASLQALPGVTSAAYGLTLPFEYTGTGRCCWSMSRVEIEGEMHEGLRVALNPVSHDYFETLRIPFRAGSVWSASSEVETPVPAVVTERLAIDVFGSAEAAMDRVIGSPDRRQLRVVGVVGDAKHYGLDQPDPVAAYVPISIVPFTIPLAHMVVKVRGEAPEGLARTLREAVWRAAPDLPIPTVRPMDEWMHASMSGRRFDSAIFGSFGAVALFLAAAGLYGTLLYTVRQRRRELGIRLALGAARSRVERQVVAGGFRLALVGTVVGAVAAAWVGRFLESRLYEVEAADPFALGGAVAVLLVTALLASWLPARRASRTDPLQTLKAE